MPNPNPNPNLTLTLTPTLTLTRVLKGAVRNVHEYGMPLTRALTHPCLADRSQAGLLLT